MHRGSALGREGIPQHPRSHLYYHMRGPLLWTNQSAPGRVPLPTSLSEILRKYGVTLGRGPPRPLMGGDPSQEQTPNILEVIHTITWGVKQIRSHEQITWLWNEGSGGPLMWADRSAYRRVPLPWVDPHVICISQSHGWSPHERGLVHSLEGSPHVRGPPEPSSWSI